MKTEIAVIGGGASGMIAAITARKSGKEVVILERKDRILKKVLITGNGRCNITNVNADISNYFGKDISSVENILNSFNPQDTMDFFNGLGVVCNEENRGKVYPLSGQASSVVDALRFEAERLGINQATIVAVLGSAGVAIGLAWQGSLSNFAGGMIILVSRPFSRGDYIITPKAEGIVDTIGIIYTILLTPDNKRISIPNGALANDVITNVTANDIRRIDIQVGVAYNTDIRRAKKLIKEAFDENGLVLKNNEILSYVSELASSAVILGGRAWCKTEDYWTARWGIIEEIKVKFDKNGIEIPYDQLEVHINESKNSLSKK